MLAGPSRYLVREICDQSVIVLRDRDGDLKAYHNVCQHRAHRLLEGEGALPLRIVCPYHNWAYDHDGRLVHARGTEGMTGVRQARYLPAGGQARDLLRLSLRQPRR